MVKRRDPEQLKKKRNGPTSEEVEAFAAAADGGLKKIGHGAVGLDQHAKRDFKKITVPFNEYEYGKLDDLSRKTGRTKLNLLRWAMLRLSDDIDNGTKSA